MNYQNVYYGPPMPKKKKKNTVLVISVCLIIILIILLVLYIMFNTKEEEAPLKEENIIEKPVEPEPKKERDYNLIAMNLMNTLVSYNYIGTNQVFNQITKYITDGILYAKDLDNEIVYQVIMNKYYNNHPKEISVNDFNNKVKKIFDESFIYSVNDYSSTCVNGFYKLDKDNNKYYSINSNKCNRISIQQAPYKISKITSENDFLYLEIKILFTDSKGQYYYSNIEKTQLLIDANRDNYEDYFNQGSTYIFTFTKNINDDYVFYRSEKV